MFQSQAYPAGPLAQPLFLGEKGAFLPCSRTMSVRVLVIVWAASGFPLP
jgi:hypothetical protein